MPSPPTVLLHVPTPGDAWPAAWHLESVPAVLLMAAAAGYLLARRAARAGGRPTPSGRQACAYLAGLSVLAIALMGPPDHYAGVSFAVHMVQHLLLTLVAAPLIALGRPVHALLLGPGARRTRPLLRPTLGRPGVRRALALLAHPLIALLAFNGALLAWHHPALYQAALRSRPVHELEHASFLGGALLFWWVLIAPIPRRHRPSPTAALLMLFASWMAGDLLGAALTLAREPIYPVYAEASTPWGLTPAADQRLGGLLMWIGGGGLFAALLIGFLAAPHVRRGRGDAVPRPRSTGPLPGGGP